MSYNKAPSSQYQQPVQSSGAKRHRRMPTLQQRVYGPASKGMLASPSRVLAKTRFLSKYLSGRRNVMVKVHPDKTSQRFFTEPILVDGKPFYRTNVPDWKGFDPELKGEPQKRWTDYKWSVAHEDGGHVRFTPKLVYGYGQRDPLAHHVMNLVEDRRIEDLETRTFPGNLADRLWSNGYVLTKRPDPAKMYEAADKLDQAATPLKSINDPRAQAQFEGFTQRAENIRKQARLEMLLQDVIIQAVKNKKDIPKPELDRVEKATKEVLDVLNDKKTEEMGAEESRWDDLVRKVLDPLVQKVIKDLDLRGLQPPSGGQGHGEGTLTPDFDDTREQPAPGEGTGDVDADMQDYFDQLKEKADKKKREDGDDPNHITQEDIEDAESGGSDQSKKEYENMENPGSSEGGGEDVPPELSNFEPIETVVPPEAFMDYRFEQDMFNRLRELRKGKRIVHDKYGSFLSIPALLNAKDTPFLREIRRSVKGQKIMLEVDFSGSMHGNQEAYKKALISTMKVFDGLGIKTAMVGFGGESVQKPNGESEETSAFFRVKGFERPRWTELDSGKVAALGATYGSTPTAALYAATEDYIVRHRPDYVITVTDGSPNDPGETKRMVRRLRKHTKMIAFGIGDPNSMTKMLQSFDYNGAFGVASVSEIPAKLVKLIAG